MGAHLAGGRVEEGGLRCFFHGWKFDPEGGCLDVPCLGRAHPARAASWPVAEHYGVLWVYTGRTPRAPLPQAPGLEGRPVAAAVGRPFRKACHPNVVMVNAIDAHHFNTVHRLPVKMDFREDVLSPHSIRFANTVSIPRDRRWNRLLGAFYRGPLTYLMTYHFGSTGSVTVGPDFWHAHNLFALRPRDDGGTEGLALVPVSRRPGALGWLVNRLEMALARAVGAYFAKGDTEVFQGIRFHLRTPLAQDQPILRFMAHLDAQPARAWGSWELLGEGSP
jgi:phenylpropionate dioxygenase-like ring-hydroxylating dioxygenase large terminal subunit